MMPSSLSPLLATPKSSLLCYNMAMIKFSGTRAEYGLFIAERLAQNGHDFYSTANMDTLRTQLKIYQKYYPEIIEENTAIATALGIDVDLLLYEEIASFVDHQRHQTAKILFLKLSYSSALVALWSWLRPSFSHPSE